LKTLNFEQEAAVSSQSRRAAAVAQVEERNARWGGTGAWYLSQNAVGFDGLWGHNWRPQLSHSSPRARLKPPVGTGSVDVAVGGRKQLVHRAIRRNGGVFEDGSPFQKLQEKRCLHEL